MRIIVPFRYADASLASRIVVPTMSRGRPSERSGTRRIQVCFFSSSPAKADFGVSMTPGAMQFCGLAIALP